MQRVAFYLLSYRDLHHGGKQPLNHLSGPLRQIGFHGYKNSLLVFNDARGVSSERRVKCYMPLPAQAAEATLYVQTSLKVSRSILECCWERPGFKAHEEGHKT